ncbi:MAG: hypothetical protein AB3N24_12355 [Leisingera sp.]
MTEDLVESGVIRQVLRRGQLQPQKRYMGVRQFDGGHRGRARDQLGQHVAAFDLVSGVHAGNAAYLPNGGTMEVATGQPAITAAPGFGVSTFSYSLMRLTALFT